MPSPPFLAGRRRPALQWHIRRPDAVMYRRQHLATLVLDANWSRRPADQVIAGIRADIPGRSLFVHAAKPRSVERLGETPGFALRFRDTAGSVFEETI